MDTTELASAILAGAAANRVPDVVDDDGNHFRLGWHRQFPQPGPANFCVIALGRRYTADDTPPYVGIPAWDEQHPQPTDIDEAHALAGDWLARADRGRGAGRAWLRRAGAPLPGDDRARRRGAGRGARGGGGGAGRRSAQ